MDMCGQIKVCKIHQYMYKCIMWLSGGELVNVTELLVSEGLVEVRQVGSRPSE